MLSVAVVPEYEVRRVARDPDPLARSWDDAPWSGIPRLTLDHHVGSPPSHRPAVAAKLAWSEGFLFVSFRVDDRWVVAAAERHQDAVCNDSCVELFFTPGEHLEEGYFNIEVNCGGTVLFHHQRTPRGTATLPAPSAIEAMGVRHSLPARVVPEVPGPVTWTVGYRVPIADLAAFAPVREPAPGVLWRANLYKCADRSSHPHWLAWAPIREAKLDFHVPASFGTLRFVE